MSALKFVFWTISFALQSYLINTQSMEVLPALMDKDTFPKHKSKQS